jgi:hypothetical protein
MGAKVSFYPEPEKAVIGMIAQPKALRVAGEVVGTSKVVPFGKGKIPDLGLKVRGRSGKTMNISVVANYVERHSNWREADATIKGRSGE